MLKISIVTLLLLIFAGCSSIKENMVKQFDCEPHQFQYDSVYTDSDGYEYFISDSFADRAVEDYSIEQLKENYMRFLNLEKTPTQNIHDTTVTDTIYEFFNKNNTIAFYRAQHKDLLKEFDITSSKFRLYGCISAGQSKDSLSTQFGITKPLKDTIKIGNEEQSSVFTFYFEDGEIARVVSTPYFD